MRYIVLTKDELRNKEDFLIIEDILKNRNIFLLTLQNQDIHFMNISSKNIAIIGAGWLGIGCLRILKDQGYSIDVYEQNDDIGGVWHPSNNYVDLKIHQPSGAVEYFDFPLPSYIDKSQRISSNEVFKYLQSYCKFNDMYKHIKFNVKVIKINYASDTNTTILYYQDTKGKEILSKKYDYIIFTGAYSNKNMPKYPDENIYSGKILHSFEANKEIINQLVSEKKKITIVGAGKTAADFVYYFSKIDYPIIWLYRSAYWFFSFNKIHDIVSAKFNKDRFNLKAIYSRCVYAISFFLFSLNPMASWWFLRSLGFIKTYGKKNPSPDKFHNGNLTDDEIASASKFLETYGIQGEIKSFEKSGIRLQDGKLIETDVVIYCTGTGYKDKIMDIEVDGTNMIFEEKIRLYHGKIIPELPHLIFAAFKSFTVGTLNGLNTGAWIDNYIKNPLSKQLLMAKSENVDTRSFIKQVVFVDNENQYINIYKALKPYIFSGEVSIFEINRSSWDAVFGTSGTKPMKFKNPRYYKK